VEFSLATVQIALIFIPGLFWTMLDAAHRPTGQSGQFVYTLRVFVFGVISYAFLGVIYQILGREFDILSFADPNWSFAKIGDEVLWAVATSLALSVVWIAGRTHKIVTRILNKIGASNHIADQDIWEFVFTSDAPKIKFAHVRDYENEVIYAGYVRAYSDRLDLRELAMTDVQVFNGEGVEIYSTPLLYLARPNNGITLEFPVIDEKGDANG
jgi:hypothetical protein